MRIDNAETSTPGHRFDALAVVIIVLAGVALAFRRALPRLHLYAILVCTVAYIARDYVGGPFFLAIFIAIGTVASILPTREAIRPAVIAFDGAGRQRLRRRQRGDGGLGPPALPQLVGRRLPGGQDHP